MRTRSPNPLEPIATVVNVLLTVTVVLTTVGAVAAVVGTGSIAGLGASDVYVDVPGIAGSSYGLHGMWSPHDGVSVNTTGYRIFVADPDVGQRLWYTLTLLPAGVLFVGALVLVNRLVRGAQRDGIFTVATAARFRALGWFLLAGVVVKMVVEHVATYRLLDTMVIEEIGWFGQGFPAIPWTVLLVAAGLLTFARIMRLGVEMRKDLEGTV